MSAIANDRRHPRLGSGRVAAGPRRRAIAGWALLGFLALAGCKESLNVRYGLRDGSINGTLAFANMFEDSGRSVIVRRSLSPSVERSHTIVWFSRTPDVPSQETLAWFEAWMLQPGKRTLIYVRRDYDAEPDYWREMVARAPKELKDAFASRCRQAIDRVYFEGAISPPPLSCEWYTVQAGKPRDANSLEGSLVDGLDAKPRGEAAIRLRRQMFLADEFDTILASSEDQIVGCCKIGARGRSLVVANGSFLLNLPLVDREHRQLAGRLIEMTAENERVVFLETSGDPRIMDSEPKPEYPSGLALLGVWPLNVVLLQLAAAGILFCFARWPIFGRPQDPSDPNVGDFSLHAEALGKLLRRSTDREHALRRLADYRNSKL